MASIYSPTRTIVADIMEDIGALDIFAENGSQGEERRDRMGTLVINLRILADRIERIRNGEATEWDIPELASLTEWGRDG